MRISWKLVAAIAALVSCTSAQNSTSKSVSAGSSAQTSMSKSISKGSTFTTLTSTSRSVSKGSSFTTLTQSLSSARATSKATITSAPPSRTSLSPCGLISSSIDSYFSAFPSATSNPILTPSVAMACLESVPLDVDRSLGFVEYITPYIEFQATLAYLKNPPSGYTLSGVDVLGGLAEITQKLKHGSYENQYCFEKELWILVNVLPRDFHFNLPLPLISLFSFQTEIYVVSVSPDGKAIPQPYALGDLSKAYHANTSISWTPSPIVTIDGRPAADVLLKAGLETLQYSDPDAIYNLLFYSLPLYLEENGSAWVVGGHVYGFANDTTTYGFANGSTLVQKNIAVTNVDFSQIDSGTSLFEVYELPAASDTSAATSTISTGSPSVTPTPITTSTAAVTTTKINGYPTPVILHPDGYTGGYFLPNSSVAVLVISGFINTAETVGDDYIQQQVIKKFLVDCKTAGKTKLIVDVQANGGGSVYNGIDAFKQLFPTIEPFGGTRFRYNALVGELSKLWTESGVYNTSALSPYQTQAELDANLQDFKSYQDLVGPFEIYGDEFTALVRNNLSDTTQQVDNDIIVSGYANETNIPPQVFAAEDVVLLYDGTCGSTCAVFSELMKSQGGVRSVAVGGRPKPGPMQGVAGSKGAQVWTYGNVQDQIFGIAEIYGQDNLPSALAAFVTEFLVSADPPLGQPLTKGARFNLRNNYNSSSPSELPLQFIYEAANCRLYYQPADLFDITSLWERVVGVTWNGAKCVQGSTVKSDDTMPTYSWQTVSFGPGAVGNFTLDANLPGNIVNGTEVWTGKENEKTIAQVIHDLAPI